MMTRSLTLLLIAATGCFTSAPVMPSRSPAEAVPEEAATDDTQHVLVGGRTASLRIVHDNERVDFVQRVNGQETVLASARPDVTTSYEVRAHGPGAIAIERTSYAISGVDDAQVWRFRWDAAKRTLVLDAHVKAAPHEELPAWVPDDVRERHAGRHRFGPGEEPCTVYSDRVSMSAYLDQGVEAILICNHGELAASLVVFEGDERHVLQTFEAVDEVGLVQDPKTGAVVAIAGGKAFSVEWDGTNGPGSRPLKKVPPFAKAVLP